MVGILTVLVAVVGAAIAGGPGVALAQETALGPALTRSEAGLTVEAEIGPPQALDGADETGAPLFVPAERGLFFLAVDVRGARGNKNGFGLNEFVPYLTVAYSLKARAGGTPVHGVLHAFVGRQGLRYGNNVVAPGPGPYELTVTLESPIKVGFGRHTDMETGVGRWWPAVQLEWPVELSRVTRR